MPLLAVVDFTESGMNVQKWINTTLSLYNVCFVLTESQQDIEPFQSATISLQETNSTGKILYKNLYILSILCNDSGYFYYAIH